MSGGKGGTSSTSVEIPAWLESAARQNIARADQIAQIGYVPYYGPDVAAMTPMQMAAGGNINAAASAFGLGAPSSAMQGMPMAQDFGGMAAYSSAPLYEQSLAQLQARRPGQFAALQAPFINPLTGAPPAAPFSANLAFADQTMAPLMPAAVANAGGGGSGMIAAPAPVDSGYSGSFASSPVRAALPGGVNDPFLTSGFSQAVARTFDTPQSPPTAADRPVMRPDRDTSAPSQGGSGRSSGSGRFTVTHSDGSVTRHKSHSEAVAAANASAARSGAEVSDTTGRESNGGMGGGK